MNWVPQYLKPLIPGYIIFLKQMGGALFFLLVLRWLPDLHVWVARYLYSIDYQKNVSPKYEFIIWVAYVIFILTLVFGIAGMIRTGLAAKKESREDKNNKY